MQPLTLGLMNTVLTPIHPFIGEFETRLFDNTIVLYA